MKLIVTCGILLIHLNLLAQIEQAGVLGLTVDNGLYPYRVQLMGEKGLALFQETKANRSPGQRNWEITFLDSTLHTTRKMTLQYDVEYSLYFTAYVPGYCYLLFVNQFNPKGTIHLVRIELSGFEAKTFDISGFVPYALKFFSVMGGTIILAGEEMHKPSVVCYQFGDNRPMILQGLFRRDSELMHIVVSPDKNYFTVYMSVPGSNRKKSITAVSYNSQAELIRSLTFMPTRKYELLDGLCTEGSEGSYLMAGSYSATKMAEANGIFLARISPDGKQTINYYNFTSLRNFFNFLPEKVRDRLKEKARKKNVQGKSVNYGVNLAVRQIDTSDDEKVFMADCFNQSSFFNAFNYRWNAGLEYTHSIVAGFGDDGKLKWDNELTIQEDAPGFDQQKAFYEKSPNGNGIIFNIQNEDIMARRIFRSEQLDKVIRLPMKLDFAENYLSHDHNIWSVIKPWYSRTYLVFGMINMNDYNKGDAIFFLLKLVVNPED